MSEVMTEEQIYTALGLEDPTVFALKRMRANLAESRVQELGAKRALDQVHQGTGKTTQRIIEALMDAMLERPVTIVAYPEKMRGQILRQVAEYAHKLERPDAIRWVSVSARASIDAG